ncbi:MAG: peptidoglycan-binding protein [Treponema sp.]|nr:peptidoglycan-binding protein [Treponema sp.]
MKKFSMPVFLLVMFVSFAPHAEAQNFSRIIQMQRSRMNGPDVAALQRRLLSLGFKKTGAADGWYGPLTEGSIKTIQSFMAFPQDGRVTRNLWNVIFDDKQEGLLRDIGIIANQDQITSLVTRKGNETNVDFDEWSIGSFKDEVKIVTFRHINEGLIIFRFTLYYSADAVFMIQDVYYGDYRRRVFLKTARDFVELRNGERTPADPAMEGILNRVREGIAGAGLKAPPPPIPDFGAVPAAPAGAPANAAGQRPAAAPANPPAQSPAPSSAPAVPPAASAPASGGASAESAAKPPASVPAPAAPMTPTPKDPTPISP